MVERGAGCRQEDVQAREARSCTFFMITNRAAFTLLTCAVQYCLAAVTEKDTVISHH